MNRNMEAVLWANSARGLSAVAWRILNKLAARVNSQRGDFDVWPSHEQIAFDAETSVASVKRHMAELTDDDGGKKHPFIKIVPRFRRSGGKAANVYRLQVRLRITMPNEEIVVDCDEAGDSSNAAAIAQFERSRSLTGDLSIEPSESGTLDTDSPVSPQDEDRDLFGQPLKTDEQLLAEQKSDAISVIEVGWSKLADQIPKMRPIRGKLDDARAEKAFQLGLKHAQKGQTAADVWREILAKIEGSGWLCGEILGTRSNDYFSLQFTWIVEPKNFGKVLEGRYDGGRNPAGRAAPGPGSKAAARVLDSNRSRREQRNGRRNPPLALPARA